MMPELFQLNEEYDVVSVNDKPYLFIQHRIDRDSVPENAYVYDVGDADGNGCFSRIQKFVLVNFWGTIIGWHELPLEEDGRYYPPIGSAEYEGSYHDPMTLGKLAALTEEEEKEYEGVHVVNDGEYAVFPEHRYLINGNLSGIVDESTFMSAAEYLDGTFEKVTLKVNERNTEIMDYEIVYRGSKFSPERIEQIHDAINSALEEYGVTDCWPSVKILE